VQPPHVSAYVELRKVRAVGAEGRYVRLFSLTSGSTAARVNDTRTCPKERRLMTGIRFVTDEKGHKVAVQIDLKKYGARLEDFWDGLIPLR
jgi:hypothetical protein